MEYISSTAIPSPTLLVLPSRLTLYRLLVITEIGFILLKKGTYFSTIALIQGPIIPDRKDRNKVVEIAIAVLTLALFLLETPINMPKITPSKLPSNIKIRL